MLHSPTKGRRKFYPWLAAIGLKEFAARVRRHQCPMTEAALPRSACASSAETPGQVSTLRKRRFVMQFRSPEISANDA
jgi:hypothetical protein